MTQTTRHIQAYSLLEYTQKLNEALNEGYELRLDTNEGTCQHIGFYFEVLMYKEMKTQPNEYNIPCEYDNTLSSITVPLTIDSIKVQPQKQRGRPSSK